MDKLELKALGKINLGLDVLGRRENGYHDVRMVMQTLYLYDNVTLQKKSAPGIEIDSNLFYLPNDEDNIAWKAAKLLIDEFDIKDGIRIHLDKHIPVAAALWQILQDLFHFRLMKHLSGSALSLEPQEQHLLMQRGKGNRDFTDMVFWAVWELWHSFYSGCLRMMLISWRQRKPIW